MRFFVSFRLFSLAGNVFINRFEYVDLVIRWYMHATSKCVSCTLRKMCHLNSSKCMIKWAYQPDYIYTHPHKHHYVCGETLNKTDSNISKQNKSQCVAFAAQCQHIQFEREKNINEIITENLLWYLKIK